MYNSKKVYHYTSPDGLISIICNKTLWFTDSQFLNDRGELTIALEAACEANKELIGETKEATKLELLKYADEELNHIKDEGSLYKFNWATLDEDNNEKSVHNRYYVLCASECHDISCMWGNYMKNDRYLGYNLSIDTGVITRQFFEQRLIINHEKVVYDKSEQVKEFSDFIRGSLENCIDNPTPEEMKYMGMELIGKLCERIDERKLFYKAKAFENENEYRFVIEWPDTKADSKSMPTIVQKQYRVGNSGVITPYLEWKWGENASDLISQITLSPTLEEDIARVSFRQLLDDYDMEGVLIESSSIKLRS